MTPSIPALWRRLRQRARPYYHRVGGRAAWRLARWARSLGHAETLALGRRLGDLWYAISPLRRRNAAANLDFVFAGRLSPAMRRDIARRAFRSVGASMLEANCAVAWNASDFSRVVAIDGESNFHAARAGGRGVICVAAHLGCWPLLGSAIRHHTGAPVALIVRSQRNAELEPLLAEMRQAHGVRTFLREAPALGWLQTLRANNVVLLLGDLDARNRRAVTVDFLGRPTRAFSGYAHVARTTGAAILPVTIARSADDPTRHLIRWYRPLFIDTAAAADADTQRLVQQVMACFDQAIRACPDQWVWMHERWPH